LCAGDLISYLLGDKIHPTAALHRGLALSYQTMENCAQHEFQQEAKVQLQMMEQTG
jgi:phospholipase/lecithinase/hemolysin